MSRNIIHESVMMYLAKCSLENTELWKGKKLPNRYWQVRNWLVKNFPANLSFEAFADYLIETEKRSKAEPPWETLKKFQAHTRLSGIQKDNVKSKELKTETYQEITMERLLGLE